MKLTYERHSGPKNNKVHEFQVIIDSKEYTIIQTPISITIIDPNGEELYLDTKRNEVY